MLGKKAVISGIAKNDLSNITDTGKKAITKLGTVVKAGTGITIDTPTVDATTGQTTYTVSANEQVESVTATTLKDDENLATVAPVTGNDGAANTKYGVSVSKQAVTAIAKASDISVANTTYQVTGDNGTVTLTYVDGNGKTIDGRQATITGIAKNDLSNITNGGKQVISNVAKDAVIVTSGSKNVTVTPDTSTDGKVTYAVSVKESNLAAGTNTTVTGTGTAKDPYKVNVTGDINNITSITNTKGSGAVSFDANGVTTFSGGQGATDKKVTVNGTTGTVSTGDTTVSTTGVVVKNDKKESKVDSTGATFIDDTAATNVTSTTIRVNGKKGDNNTVTGGVVIGNQSVTPSA
ncbi:hypothetical protein, partial [Veillonella montpellierensis]|uniref:hypothetical protein n=1 Tax=Veillonella montpellierensis TaxID=187328 RepID=UPI0012E02493